MLNAIIYGKAGRMGWGGQKESLSWRQVFQTREDLLTATFFERFTYLSDLLQHQLLNHWLNEAGDFTEFEGIDYWPKYDLPKQDKREYVEPDLLLRYKTANVLVEVKPPEGGTQYLDQWLLELEGYFEQHSSSTPLYFLAIGQVGNVLAQFAAKAQNQLAQLQGINTLEWQPIASDLEKRLCAGDLNTQDQRIVLDMLNALELYGVRAQNLSWDELMPLASALGPLDFSEKLLTILDNNHG